MCAGIHGRTEPGAPRPRADAGAGQGGARSRLQRARRPRGAVAVARAVRGRKVPKVRHRVHSHPPPHAEIKYMLPMLPSDGVLLQDNKVNNSDETDDATTSIDDATRDDEPRQTIQFYLRGRRGDVASRQ